MRLHSRVTAPSSKLHDLQKPSQDLPYRGEAWRPMVPSSPEGCPGVYRDDLEAAQTRVSNLERENKGLNDENKRLGIEVATLRRKIPPDKPKKVKKMKCRECGGRLHRVGLALFGIVAAVIVFGSLAWLIYTAATEHGPSGCYVESEGMTFKLKQSIEWGSDRTIGQYRSMDEAIQDANKINCQVERSAEATRP